MDKEIVIALIGFAGAVVPALIGLLAKREPGAARGGVPVLQWIAYMALGAGVAGALAGVVGQMVPAAGPLGARAPHLANWAFFGGMIGGAQWRALHAAGLSPRLWVIASVLGWMPCAFFFTEPWAWIAFGALSGTAQALLCPRTVLRPLAWIAVNAVAWALAGLAGTALGLILTPQTGFAVAWVVGWVTVGLVAGIVTAIALKAAIRAPGGIAESPRGADT